MKSNFGDRVSFATYTAPDAAEAGSDEKPENVDKGEFVFNFLPRDIKAHLDRFVIKQDEAKKVLSIAVCDHYNHAKYLRQLEKEDAARAEETEYAKQNVLLVGPTGVGKTYLIKHIAELIKVPFVKADATKFSETGYVGGDVEDLVRELVQKADGDVNLAQFGIIYIDEIDKIASASNLIGRDVRGRGVQTTLLRRPPLSTSWIRRCALARSCSGCSATAVGVGAWFGYRSASWPAASWRRASWRKSLAATAADPWPCGPFYERAATTQPWRAPSSRRYASRRQWPNRFVGKSSRRQ